jgi:hypothetical protein
MLSIYLYFYLFFLLVSKFIETFLTHEISVLTRPESTIIRVARIHDELGGRGGGGGGGGDKRGEGGGGGGGGGGWGGGGGGRRSEIKTKGEEKRY